MKWINVKDELPEIDKRVFLSVNGEPKIGYYVEKEEDQMDQMGSDAGFMSEDCDTMVGRSFGNPKYMEEARDQPQFWMPLDALPSPPEGDADE